MSPRCCQVRYLGCRLKATVHKGLQQSRLQWVIHCCCRAAIKNQLSGSCWSALCIGAATAGCTPLHVHARLYQCNYKWNGGSEHISAVKGYLQSPDMFGRPPLEAPGCTPFKKCCVAVPLQCISNVLVLHYRSMYFIENAVSLSGHLCILATVHTPGVVVVECDWWWRRDLRATPS
jgi:hypothetical protein